MAPLKRVASLEDVCLPVVYTLIQNIIQNHDENNLSEAQLIDDLMMVVNNVPLAFHDKIADMHLCEIVKMFGKGQYLNDEENNPFCVCEYNGSDNSDTSDAKCNCVNEDEVSLDVSLKVISLLKIKKVELCEGTMPLYLLNKLIGLLDKMSNVEIFSIYDHWNVNWRLMRSKLLKMVASWSNLTSFICPEYCTDEILALVCKNCELLREVDVSHSVEMKEPIESLLTCKNLLTVNLECNGLESKHFLKLLLESKSNNLMEIRGLDDCLYETIDEFEQMKPLRTFQLQHLRVTSIGKLDIERYLRLITKYFPSLTDIAFFFLYYDVDPVCDLHILSALKHLKEVTLCFQNCSSVTVSRFLSACPHVTTANFGPERNSDLSFFLNEVSQSCPFIDKLIIRNSSRFDFSYRFNEGVRLAIKPFQNLTHLIWPNAPLTYFMYVLRDATNIKIIELLVELHSSTTGSTGIFLTDKFFRSLFKNNPLNQLEKLYIDCPNSLTPEMIMYIIKNCEKLTSLSVRDSNPNCLRWSKVRKFISQNNYGVDFELITGEKYYHWRFRF